MGSYTFRRSHTDIIAEQPPTPITYANQAGVIRTRRVHVIYTTKSTDYLSLQNNNETNSHYIMFLTVVCT